MAGWLVGLLVGWSAGWLVCWSVGRLVGWLVGAFNSVSALRRGVLGVRWRDEIAAAAAAATAGAAFGD